MRSVIGTAAQYVEQGVCNGRASVCLSVCPTIRPPHATAAGLLPSTRRTGDINRLLPGAQQQRRRSTAVNAGGRCLVDG